MYNTVFCICPFTLERVSGANRLFCYFRDPIVLFRGYPVPSFRLPAANPFGDLPEDR